MDQIHHSAIELGHKFLKCEDVSLFFLDPSSPLFVDSADHSHKVNLSASSGPLGQAIKTVSMLLYSKDVENAEEGVDYNGKSSYYLALPIKKKDRHQASIVIRFGQNSEFSDEQKKSVEWISEQISNLLSIQNNLEQTLLIKEATELLIKETDLDKLLKSILQFALRLSSTERCSIFLHDKEKGELYSRIFDEEIGVHKEKTPQIRFPSSVGIAGYVARNGQYQLVPDAYADERFNRSVDIATGFKTRNILCIPLLNESEVIGVLQMVNKPVGVDFTQIDVETGTTFGNLAGIAIRKAQLFEELKKSEGRLKVALEVVAYHTAPPKSKVKEFESLPILKLNEIPDFGTFYFNPLNCSHLDMCQYVITIFHTLGLVDRFQIPHSNLCHFVLSISEGYRDVPYHNWRHAFSVCHFFFVISRKVNLVKYLHEYEIFSLLVSCLCHDIDHRGRNNAFQVLKKTSLSGIYGESIMEQHHFNYAVSLLSSPDNNILVNLTTQEYNNFIQHMKFTILATDLANHFKTRGNFQKTLASNPSSYDKSNPEHRLMVTEILMTSSDISACIKPWIIAQPYADLIYKEFFEQGDEEKLLGKTPIPMMDRDVVNIPQQQIDFISFIASFCYNNLVAFLPELAELSKQLEENNEHWKQLLVEGSTQVDLQFLPSH